MYVGKLFPRPRSVDNALKKCISKWWQYKIFFKPVDGLVLLCARAGVKNLSGYPEGVKLHMSVTVNLKGKKKKIYTRNTGSEKKRYRKK